VPNVNIIKKKELGMDAAKNLFETLANFKANDNSDLTCQQRLMNYCKQVLGSTERLNYDYKTKTDTRNATLSQDDKKNLAKAISGFANSSGGILIWGLDNDTLDPKPICEIQKFVSNMLQLAPQSTDPLVSGINGEWLRADGANPDEGFALVYIPESVLPPHRVILKINEVKDHYYTRSGDSFVIATHTQLEDMFGRRPKPVLNLSKRFIAKRSSQNNLAGEIIVFIGISNLGRGSASAPFLSLNVHHPYEITEYGIDGNGRFGLPRIIMPIDATEQSFGSTTNFTIHPGISFDIARIKVEIDGSKAMRQTITPDLVIDYKMASEGIQLIQGQEIIEGKLLLSEYLKRTS
jgi:hypothetical protein